MLHRPQRPAPPLFDRKDNKTVEAPSEPDLIQEYLRKNTGDSIKLLLIQFGRFSLFNLFL